MLVVVVNVPPLKLNVFVPPFLNQLLQRNVPPSRFITDVADAPPIPQRRPPVNANVPDIMFTILVVVPPPPPIS